LLSIQKKVKHKCEKVPTNILNADGILLFSFVVTTSVLFGACNAGSIMIGLAF
jgi:hypothetical protein